MAYHGLTQGLLFFAEDVFGNQFACSDGNIVRFLAETGDCEFMARSFEEWLEKLLTDPDEELSLWLLNAWRAPGNLIQANEHLCPKIPFVAGGAFEPAGLYVADRTESLTFKGDFAWQIRKVPSGGRIRIKSID